LAKAQGSGDLTEAPAAVIGTISQENLFPRKLAHLCLRSSVTVLFAAPAQNPFVLRRRRIRHAREDGLAHFSSARQLLPALALNPFCE
jgi:hypothetical protein